MQANFMRWTNVMQLKTYKCNKIVLELATWPSNKLYEQRYPQTVVHIYKLKTQVYTWQQQMS